MIVLLAASVIFSCGFLQAQTTQLLPLNQVWKYNQSGADLGMEWRQPGYDDSTWLSGPGVLAKEDNSAVTPLVNTQLSRTNSQGNYTIIDYFRTHFQGPSLQPGFFLIASNLVDDGAVVYLNGTEIFRIRMPTGPVTAGTLASEIIDVTHEGIFVVTNISASALLAGDNVLAVEVHQPYVTSSDVVLGIVLFYAAPVPLSFSSQPTDRTVLEGTGTTFTVGAAGSFPLLQWYKDSVRIPNATNQAYTIPLVTRNDAAQYFIVASNYLGTVTSRVATLTVVLDEKPPALVDASQIGANLIVAHFDKLLDPQTAEDAANYHIFSSDTGNLLAVSSAGYQGAGEVVLQIDPIVGGRNYVLTVSNVADRAGNRVPPGTAVAIRNQATVCDMDGIWKYDDSGNDLGTAWRETAFDDSAWKSGPALLYNDVNFTIAPGTVRRTAVAVTTATGEPIITTYFRRHFTLAGVPSQAQIMFRWVVDDGLLIHLNGQPIVSYNLPAGSLTASSRAASSAVEGTILNTGQITVTNCRAGDNVLAVEVHQFSTNSPNAPDITFGLEAILTADSFASALPIILQPPQTVSVLEGQPGRITARVLGAETLFWLRAGQIVANAGSNSLFFAEVSLLDHGAAFRLVASNSFGMVTSAVASLLVGPDIIPPRVLSAAFGLKTNQVLIAFSEPVEPGSASDLAHYRITDLNGGPLQILGTFLTNRTNVVLFTAPRFAGTEYLLRTDGIQDASAAHNRSQPAQSGIGYEVELVSFDGVWRYDDAGIDRGTSWREVNFDDAAWPSGPGLLGNEDAPLAEPVRTVLVPPEFRGATYYFRHRFNFPRNTAGVFLGIRYFADDGVVLFLNGQEAYRVRVPAGQNGDTLATQGSPDAMMEGMFFLPAGALVTGMNVFAAEVHQVSRPSADSLFGLQLLQLFFQSPAPVGPYLQIGRSPQGLVLQWDDGRFVLEGSSGVDGSWRPAPHPTIPYRIAPANAEQFYRLRW